MKKRKLGNTDLNCSEIGFGGWVIAGSDSWTDTDDRTSARVVREAYDLGINFYDVAAIYGFGHAEELLGKALHAVRKDCIIATKCGLVWNEEHDVYRLLSPKSIHKEIDDSLRRLNTDYVDLYQIHFPDFQTPIDLTMEALMKIKQAGKARYIGVSNMPVFEIEDAMVYGEVVSSQNLYNLIDRNSRYFNRDPLLYKTEEEIIPFCSRNGLGFIPYAPLCQGLLTGTFKASGNFHAKDVRNVNGNLVGDRLTRNLARVEMLRKVSAEIGKPVSQVGLNWLLRRPAVTTVIAGSTKSEFLHDNVASSSWEMDDAAHKQVSAIFEGASLETIR